MHACYRAFRSANIDRSHVVRWLALFSLLCTSIVATAQTATDLTPRNPNIAYVDDGDARHVLDVYLPEMYAGDEPLPTLFMLHGGGYIGGRKEFVRPVAEYFAEQGYAVVAPNYRLAPRHTFPAAIDDSFCALAWTYAHADVYGFDLERLFLIGESAGGNAAAMLGTVDDPAVFLNGCEYTLPSTPKPSGVIAYYMPADLDCNCRGAQRFAALFLGVPLDADIQTVREEWRVALPATYLTGDEPPFLLIHGTEDSLVPFSEAEAFYAQAAPLIEIDLVAIEGADHGFFVRLQAPQSQTALAAVEMFLARHLTP